MAGAKNHDYHILEPDIWPLIGSMSALTFTSGMVLMMHEMSNWQVVLGLGIMGLIATFFMWFRNIVNEAEGGDHTPVVQLHMRYGMILFIASEVMFFVGWFWSFFDFALFPAPIEADPSGAFWVNKYLEEGSAALAQFPPKGLEVLNAFELPLLNTLILLCSGTTVTWAHHALIHDERGGEKQGLWGLLGVGVDDGVKKGLWLTIALGLVFTAIQAYEYSVAPFGFGMNTYGSAFYMATGFHGFHVLIGTIFLIVCLCRAYVGHFTARQHFGFEAAAWYWHFVDVVWLFLFIAVYIWGGWGAPVH